MNRFRSSRHYCPPRLDDAPVLDVALDAPTMPVSRNATGAKAIPIIRMVAACYQDHRALKRLNLTPKEWTALFQVLSQIFQLSELYLITGHTYAARLANVWNADAPFAVICPLRIMCAVSIPESVAEAAANDLKPIIGRVNRLMKR